MKNFIQCGDMIELAAPYAVSSGDGMLVGAIFGIAATDAVLAAKVQAKTDGVFVIKKTSAEAWATVGLAIYWDDTAKEVTTVSVGNTKIGVNTAVAANPSSTGIVRLNGVF